MATKAENRKKRMADVNKRDSFSRFTTHLTELGIPQWLPKAGQTYLVDVVPYLVKKSQARFLRGNAAAPGELYCERTYWTHRGIGPNEVMVNCPTQFGHPCVPCEERRKLEQNPKFGRNSDEVKALWTSQRMVMLVYVHEEREKGLQWFDVSNHAFGKQLDKKRKFAAPEIRDKVRFFFDPSKEGFTLRVAVTEADRGGGGKYPFFDVMDFVPRKKDLPEKIVEQAEGIDLGELPIEPSYEDLKRLFYGEESHDENGNGKKRRHKDKEDEDEEDEGRDETEEEDDEDEDEDTEDEDADDEDAEAGIEAGDTVTGIYKGKKLTGTVKKVKGTLATVAVKGREKPWMVELDELTLVTEDADDEEDEDEDDAPKKRTTRGKKEDDDDEGEEDDEGEGEDDDEDEEEESSDEDEDDEPPLDDEDEDDDSSSNEDDEDEDSSEDEDEDDEPKKRGKTPPPKKRRRK